MKKFGFLLLTGALTLGLAACGGNEKASTSKGTSNESSNTASSSGENEYTITATNWEFTSDKELVIKKGSTVKLNLVNKEGLHTIANEELGIDLKAGSPVEFTADTVGDYELNCSTICGGTEDHEGMKISLKIVD
ncbi:cupredoxin domain-containing protein [Pseudoneobacillus sp. C159]